eukprot:4589882-Alexandrium_andersonii.AAC.1
MGPGFGSSGVSSCKNRCWLVCLLFPALLSVRALAMLPPGYMSRTRLARNRQRALPGSIRPSLGWASDSFVRLVWSSALGRVRGRRGLASLALETEG